MSTNAAIARRTEDGSWAGNYHHWDGYPSGLGKALWDLYESHFNPDLEGMLDVLIDQHPAGWSTIVGADFDLEPGFVSDLDARQACAFCGEGHLEHADIDDHEYHPAEDARRPNCYCHGDRSEEARDLLTPDSADSLFIEWVYIFDPEARTMEVLSHRYPQDGWGSVAVVDLVGAEPDWRAIEQRAATARPVEA